MNLHLAGTEPQMLYHIAEEVLIGLFCLLIGLKAFKNSQNGPINTKSRSFLFACGFFLLAFSSTIHAAIHSFQINTNFLYQTLLGYCFGLLVIITSMSAEKTDDKKFLPLFYLPLLVLLLPAINEHLPLFNEFRPLIWISISYLSGLVAILYFAVFYKEKETTFLFAMLGFGLISISAALLFFPAQIGSRVWFAGHLLRPFGFIFLWISFRKEQNFSRGGSILYRALTAFSLLAAIPLLTFGTVMFFDNLSPIDVVSEQLLIFTLLFVTLSSALIFGLGMIIRLIQPMLQLKDRVEGLVEEGFHNPIPVISNDEIGDLSIAYNEMIKRLGNAIDEQERMCRLAATGELSATLAHEIKNPLNAIGGAASYINKNYDGTLIQEFTTIIIDEVNRINQLTQTLLNFARPLQPDPSPTDINTLVQDTLFLLEQEAKDQNVTLHTKLSGDLPPALCDYNQIKQILINLVINAFEAVGQNGTVTVTTQASARGYILIEVQDTGKGIPEIILKDIFNPFFTTKTRGTGLGLAISKKIAREHDGDLSVRSTEGIGTTFSLILQQVE